MSANVKVSDKTEVTNRMQEETILGFDPGFYFSHNEEILTTNDSISRFSQKKITFLGQKECVIQQRINSNSYNIKTINPMSKKSIPSKALDIITIPDSDEEETNQNTTCEAAEVGLNIDDSNDKTSNLNNNVQILNKKRIPILPEPLPVQVKGNLIVYKCKAGNGCYQDHKSFLKHHPREYGQVANDKMESFKHILNKTRATITKIRDDSVISRLNINHSPTSVDERQYLLTKTKAVMCKIPSSSHSESSKHPRKYYCPYCDQCFYTSSIRFSHMKWCNRKNKPMRDHPQTSSDNNHPTNKQSNAFELSTSNSTSVKRKSEQLSKIYQNISHLTAPPLRSKNKMNFAPRVKQSTVAIVRPFKTLDDPQPTEPEPVALVFQNNNLKNCATFFT